mgnify:CR=1 FL=1
MRSGAILSSVSDKKSHSRITFGRESLHRSIVVFASSQSPSAADFRAAWKTGRSSGVRKAVGADIQWLTPEIFHPIIKKARYTNFLKMLEAPAFPLSLAMFRLNSIH